jgi:hypothetical protein
VRDLDDVALHAKPPLIVCGNEHRFLVAEQLRQAGGAAGHRARATGAQYGGGGGGGRAVPAGARCRAR